MTGRYTPPKGRPSPSRGIVVPAVTIAYGARCTWWDDKRRVGSRDGTPTGLPCCPHCGGVLFETDDTSWFAGLDRYQAARQDDLPYYQAAVIWSRGLCFADPPAMLAAYAEAGQ